MFFLRHQYQGCFHIHDWYTKISIKSMLRTRISSFIHCIRLPERCSWALRVPPYASWPFPSHTPPSIRACHWLPVFRRPSRVCSDDPAPCAAGAPRREGALTEIGACGQWSGYMLGRDWVGEWGIKQLENWQRATKSAMQNIKIEVIHKGMQMFSWSTCTCILMILVF